MRALVFPVILLLSVAAAAAAGGGCKEGGAAARSSGDGKVLYESTCAACHGVDGQAVPAWKSRLNVPDLTDPALQARLTDEAIRDVIKHGSKNKNMPPWGGVFNEQQIDALVQHVRTFKP